MSNARTLEILPFLNARPLADDATSDEIALHHALTVSDICNEEAAFGRTAQRACGLAGVIKAGKAVRRLLDAGEIAPSYLWLLEDLRVRYQEKAAEERRYWSRG